MLPFVRTVDEQIKCLSEMARHGLKRGEKGLQVKEACAKYPLSMPIPNGLSVLLRQIERRS